MKGGISINEIKINGTQNFMGIEIPIIEGGFGEGQKVILAKTVAEIHEMELKHINEIINNNKEEFEVGVDILDLKNSVGSADPLLKAGYNKQKISNSKNIFLLSEQGYMLLVGFMKTEKAKSTRKKLRREYFSMRKELKEKFSVEDLAVLKVVKSESREEAILAMQEYRLAVVKPLEETIERQKPMVGLAELRIDKKGCYSITDVTKSLGVKRGQITNWAKSKGLIHKKLQEVNKAGEKWFKVYSTDGKYNNIGITNEGLLYIKEHLEEITK